jgi:hypothetical protein
MKLEVFKMLFFFWMLGFELNALSLNALYLLIHASNTFYLGMLFLDRTCLQGAGVTGVYHQA